LNAAGGTINTSGGSSPAGGSGGSHGRYLVAENGFFAPDAGTIVGSTREDFYNQGSSGLNPFIEGNSTTTSNIVGLVGGADVYGLKSGVSSNDAYFDEVRENAPAGAIAAIVRRADGPTAGEKYYLRDLLMVVNLTDTALPNPMLGVGAPGTDFKTPLLEQGFTRNPLFGGSGPSILGALPAGGVYATLVDNELGLKVNGSFGTGQSIEGLSFDTLDVAYILAATLDGDYNANGVVDAADYIVWRNHLGDQAGAIPNDPTGVMIGTSQYNIWKANFGSSAAASSAVIVPEPTAAILILVGSVTALRRRRAPSL
jgi:hypothetical protein